jgi:hypothetical protein
MADDAADGDATPASPEDAPKQDDAREAPAAQLDESPLEPQQEPPHSDAPSAPRSRLPTRRTVGLGFAFLAPCVVIALGIYFIAKGGAPRGALIPTPSASAAATSSVGAPQAVAPPDSAEAAASGTPSLEKAEPAGLAFDDENGDGEPAPAKKAAPKHFATVEKAAAGSCTTASVDGLSRQIIEQARCLKQNAYVPLPTRPNLALASNVFPYLELEARNHLLKALDAHTSGKMTINSALRTVAQQYLVWRWAAGKRCGVQLATPPGESNHEIGIALDVAEASAWRPALEAQEFRWLGSSDRVHFDYKGAEASTPRSVADVLAFQTLWNRNHPTDAVTADGHFSPATEQRLKKAPSDGFALGPTCGKTKH